MKKVSIYQIDAFTNKPFCGNPAAVVKSDELTDMQMQYIAKEMNLSETAFISRSGKADYKLRWFTPKVEVNLCGHATIASLHFLKETKEQGEDSALTFETRSGILKCYIQNDWYYMQIPDIVVKKYTGEQSKIYQALGISENDTEGNFILLDNGYLFIHLKKLDTVGKLKPDFKALLEFSSESPVQAVTVYTLETIEKNSSAHLRFFAPYYGIDEDPVTGSANGPLLKVLTETGKINYIEGTDLLFEQGDFVNRPGRIKVTRKNNEIYIAGNALTVLNGEIKV